MSNRPTKSYPICSGMNDRTQRLDQLLTIGVGILIGAAMAIAGPSELLPERHCDRYQPHPKTTCRRL